LAPPEYSYPGNNDGAHGMAPCSRLLASAKFSPRQSGSYRCYPGDRVSGGREPSPPGSGVLRIRPVSVRIRLGQGRRAYSSVVASSSLPRAILGPEPERLSSRADVVSGRIEHQHYHVDHTVASQTVCAVHPHHQKLIGGGHDTEAKQEYIEWCPRCQSW
jgi:hypothetical protein